jgi:hypothetical protein
MGHTKKKLKKKTDSLFQARNILRPTWPTDLFRLENKTKNIDRY